MDTNQVEAFIKLIDCKSFTKAAETLCISQSALSHRLNHLEEEVGMPLIVRSRGKREFELTHAGMEFIPIAERWLSLAQETDNLKKSILQRSLSVSSSETISYLFSRLYQEIIAEQPFFLSIRTSSSYQTISDMEAQTSDIGFTVRERVSRTLKVVPIFSERHYLVGCLGSDKRVIDPRTLDSRKELLTDWSSSFREWHDAYFDLGHRPLVAVDTAANVCNYLSDGIWCIVPACAIPYLQLTATASGHPVQVYEIPNPPPDRICYKVTNRIPRPNRVEGIRYFEEKLNVFLKENDLHM
ncbi:LysR family transcriptional regulator [Dysosmobacter sp.]|uniref:LysR family transcriptional regulator n=1 Tax=Dysosmobacter sp. TaxID=2591382 RepID=UPI002A889947|nr:LysR family transcriptional regulator [Dysosmobacter sp.]MDY3280923.1 LysR family transcriptional regulator [Dysosmobacter sp.]